jgi:hypothetical protein
MYLFLGVHFIDNADVLVMLNWAGICRMPIGLVSKVVSRTESRVSFQLVKYIFLKPSDVLSG